jgi:o-succinylbenzoate synthase
VKLATAVARPLTLRFAQPLWTARGLFDRRESIILELQDQHGTRGLGEAAPWPGFGSETAAESLRVLRGLQALLGDADLDPGAWGGHLETHFAHAPAARAALEGALWDLAARRADRSLADELATGLGPLAGPALGQVPVSALLTASEPGALREQARRAAQAGHRAAKLKLGAARLATDLERAAAAREGLGTAVALRGDANGAWDERHAREALEALAPFDFAYVEQPLSPEDIDGLARLRSQSPLRIAADESVAGTDGARRLLAAGAADVLVLKPALLGGPARTLGIATTARQAGCEVVFSHSFESAVGARILLHCAAAWGDPDAVHGLATSGLFVDDPGHAPACHHGMVSLEKPARSGTGP